MLFGKRILTAMLLTVLLLACASTGSAKPVPRDLRFLLGMYYGNGSVFLVRESKGNLEIVYRTDSQDRDFSKANIFPLQKNRFDSYTINEEGPMLAAEAGVHFERDSEGNGTVCKIGGKRFIRNFFPGEGKKDFRLEDNPNYQALKNSARQAGMPAKLQQGRAAKLVSIKSVVPSAKFALHYAGTDNIFGSSLYDATQAYAEEETAAALQKVAGRLAGLGYGLLIWEAYRPWYVSRLASDLLPKDKKHMLPLPDKGEDRNTGRAVDVSLYDLQSGEAVDMISGFDEVSVRQFPNFTGGTEQQRNLRDSLAGIMKDAGFVQGKEEWWHFTFGKTDGWQKLNIPYENIR